MNYADVLLSLKGSHGRHLGLGKKRNITLRLSLFLIQITHDLAYLG